MGYCVLITLLLAAGAAAVKDALQRKGLLPQLQANVRSQIFNVLLDSEVSNLCLPAVDTRTKAAAQDQGTTANSLQKLLLWTCMQDAQRPEPCDETLLINELIREYLVWHGLRDTLSVFIPGAPNSRHHSTAQLQRQHNLLGLMCLVAE